MKRSIIRPSRRDLKSARRTHNNSYCVSSSSSITPSVTQFRSPPAFARSCASAYTIPYVSAALHSTVLLIITKWTMKLPTGTYTVIGFNVSPAPVEDPFVFYLIKGRICYQWHNVQSITLRLFLYSHRTRGAGSIHTHIYIYISLIG